MHPIQYVTSHYPRLDPPTSFFSFVSLSLNSHILQQHLPAKVHLPPSTASFTFVERCKQYRSTVEFNFIDSTALINLGDPCKRALRRGFAAARLLRLWARIPPEEWMSVCFECCVLSGRGLCDEPITRPKES